MPAPHVAALKGCATTAARRAASLLRPLQPADPLARVLGPGAAELRAAGVVLLGLQEIQSPAQSQISRTKRRMISWPFGVCVTSGWN